MNPMNSRCLQRYLIVNAFSLGLVGLAWGLVESFNVWWNLIGFPMEEKSAMVVKIGWISASFAVVAFSLSVGCLLVAGKGWIGDRPASAGAVSS
jgi:hypothetical protein